VSLDQDKKILDELARRVRVRYSEARIWLFGSRARGDSSWDSDFDVCIVLINANEDADKFIRPVVWEVGFENERVITTIVLNEADFSCGTMSESTLVENILREGIAA
jgi:predicted nucleotidyltransferase